MDAERAGQQARQYGLESAPPSTATAPAPAPVRGRPRSEAVEQAIVEGVISLIEEGVPLTELSIERIARTAGVGKATIYRRWAGKEELFVDVVASIEEPDPELPGTSMRDDLVRLLEHMRRRGLNMRNSALLHNVIGQMKTLPKLWEAYHEVVVEPRRRAMADVLRRGVAEGELPADTDIEFAADLFTGPMLLRTVMRPDAPLADGLSERVVDTVLTALKPPVPPAR
ncbi:TetR/AcrR family transcriptional regulator C-terminal ligand-binding domain-containing protein [Streptomyces longispororuber]|uniref:TetR/AcrR family transcriptional regulator C-terminal ligand-binding domain-containing protein n=1 Tax=Streptomyces longispororuber TaxID=68230 RepID=UPI00210CD167|nr:TetR/AcrR family transcriptional regulator C-terminal ligand-binding domain-containing protein [Streptomyces longispororuber]MCQ4212627.1 TetR/AcrR family transcriptional regulator C-terminal ligand-binding domain-containing protein [Streptomyces longispororuber]